MINQTHFETELARRLVLQELLDLPHFVGEWLMQDVQLELYTG